MKPLYKHQKTSIKFLREREAVLDASDPGTGKTRVHIEDSSAHRRAGGGPTLVLAPKSLLKSAWGNDFAEFAPDMKVSIAYATNRAAAFDKEADVYITNHDAITALAKMPPSFWKRFKNGTLIVDESSAFKHATSQRSRALAKTAKVFLRRRLLSGTPNTNGICDIWHQIKVLDNGERLGSSFFAFRAVVCEPQQVGPQPNMVKWVDKPHAEATVSAMIQDIVIRHQFEDCVDIPLNHQYSVPFTLSAKHVEAYKELEDESVLYLRSNTITAVNGAVLYSKLLQLASGAVYGEDGFSVIDKDRYELVLDLVDARAHSIVFFNWAHQRDLLTRGAESRDYDYAVIDGGTTSKEREHIVEAFQKGHYKVLFAHPQSAGHGLTLTRGTATIFASPTPNLEHYQQGLKRIHRIGQTLKTETIMVVAPGTIEERVYESLMNKKLKMTELLGYLKEQPCHSTSKATRSVASRSKVQQPSSRSKKTGSATL